MEKDFVNAIKFYYITSKLKDLTRSGPLVWKVKREIKETDASHTFGCLMLLIGLYSELKPKLDFEKTFMMLAVHEFEEILIGDFTPLDSITPRKRRELGEDAVIKVLDILSEKEKYLSLISEFNDGKTLEAHFAKACDKLESVLEFKKYVDAGQTSLSNVTEEMLQNEKLKKFYDLKVYELDDVFYLFHMKQFEDLGFTEKLWFNYLKPIDTFSLL